MTEGSEGSEGSYAEGPEISDVADDDFDDFDLSDDSDDSDDSDAGVSVPEVSASHVSAPVVSDSDSDSDSDAWDGSEESGWFPDPDVEGQERYFDGSDWTPETRPADLGAPVDHLPDHAGELQRALAAATNDIDDVEDRLGNLFDRAEQHGERGGRAARTQASEAAGRAAEGQALAESLDQHEDGSGWDDRADTGIELDDDDDALADLDEALASEEPEKVKKSFFRRRS